jgi:hypothetical protein
MRKPIAHLRFPAAALILAALSLSLQSCGGKSLLPKEPSPTWTLLLTQTPTPTPTPTPTLQHTEWPVVFSDSFDEESANWQVGEMNNDYAKGALAIIGGKYYLKLTAKKTAYWYVLPDTGDLRDAYVTVKVDQINGSKNCEYGLIVRGGDTAQYFYSISSLLQGYEFQSFTSDGIKLLTLWTRSSGILLGEPNQIGVKAEGAKFVLFINGEPVDDAVDDSTVSGRAGIGILFPKPGDWIEMTFDNFEVRSPEAD